MGNNILEDFSAYIETLCREHSEILHASDDRHFMELNDQQQFVQSKVLRFPLVTLEKLNISYTGQNDGMRKNRYVEIMFLEQVRDAADFVKIQTIKNKTERIAEDFLKRMKADRKDRLNYPFLKCLTVSNIELNYVENKSINLYGTLLSLNFELPFDETLDAGRFVSSQS